MGYLFLTYQLKSSGVICSLPKNTSEVKVSELQRKKKYKRVILDAEKINV